MADVVGRLVKRRFAVLLAARLATAAGNAPAQAAVACPSRAGARRQGIHPIFHAAGSELACQFGQFPNIRLDTRHR